MENINVDTLTKEQCVKIKQELEKQSKSPALEYIENNFFFMKKSGASDREENSMEAVSAIIEKLYFSGAYDQTGFDEALGEVCLNSNLEGYGYPRAHVRTSILYFYNEAIPMEYKNNIFTYKRNHEKKEKIDESVKTSILLIGAKYRRHRFESFKEGTKSRWVMQI